LGDFLSQENNFLYEVIHDIKSPLGAIMGLSEIFLKLLSEDLKPNQKDVVNKIHHHAKFTLKLIEDLLDLEKIKRGEFPIQKTPIEIRPFLQNLVQSHQVNSGKKNILVFYNIHKDLLINADELRLQQVMNNLINNAIKFSHKGSIIDITTDDHQGFLYIKVIDRGIGISKEKLPYIFDPFANIGSIPTAHEKGSGIGLSIVKKLMELHGGDIFVESEKDKGSTFVVQLPL
jgi:signal transduction histidine kinase